jgi:hypothetical protein
MKLIYFLFIFSFYVAQPKAGDPIERTIGFLRQNNLTELYKTFADNVDLTIKDGNNVYPKDQAQNILSSFLSKNTIVAVKLIHKVDSNPDYRYGVVLLSTKGGNYRTAFSLRNNGGNFQLTELRIEEEKNK